MTSENRADPDGLDHEVEDEPVITDQLAAALAAAFVEAHQCRISVEVDRHAA